MAGLLAESFQVLAEELPPAYERLLSRLSGKAVMIRVDDEWFVAEFGPKGAEVRTGDMEGAELRIATTRKAIGRVIDAQVSLSDAVLADEVEVVGPLGALTEIQDGLSSYVHGAVRCRSFPALLERLRALDAQSGAAKSGEERA